MSSLALQVKRVFKRRPEPPLLFWIALQLPVFALLNWLYFHRPVASPSGINYDVRLYFNAATAVLNGQVPYRDFFFQYPPLALLVFVPPRWLAADLGTYFMWFNVELLVLACAGVAATAVVARRLGQPAAPTLLMYSLALVATGSIIPQRYDLAPAILVVLALAAWLNGRRSASYALLAVGTLVKIYPVLLVPLFSIAEWRTAGRSAVWRGWLIFGGLLLVVLLPFLIVAPRETVSAFGGQAGRDLEIASVPATILLLGRYIGVQAEIVYHAQLNTWDVVTPYSDRIILALTALQLALFALLYLRFLRSTNVQGAALVGVTAAVIGVGLLTSRVLSAQYIVWLFPVAFLSGGRRFLLTSALFLACALLTQMLFPFLFGELKRGAALPLLVALGRDLGLAALCLVSLQVSPTQRVAPTADSR